VTALRRGIVSAAGRWVALAVTRRVTQRVAKAHRVFNSRRWPHGEASDQFYD